MIVAICVFSLFHPVELRVQPANHSVLVVTQNGQSRTLEGSGSALLRGAATVTGRGASETDFILSVPGRIHRAFRGRLEVREDTGHLSAVVKMDRETAVASIVAAESPPGAPLEARKAQAVVARSFLTASGTRHEGFDFCDTTHCQFLRDPPAPGNINARAAEETGDLVIAYQGRAVATLYSGNCGGKTRTLEEAGWNAEEYPYFAVECPVRGGVSGHRIGMCQEGASDLAKHGKSFREILSWYFPATTLISAGKDGRGSW
ncbi:MAG TPA: SpoIID/LytB domain-containing protein [Bryobacteraceae bacterium]|nr:SpoIID/LytB domain-containing protein [Bryobacteraceae bacterium]